MKFSVAFERTYPHPRKAVWQALTNSEALGEWLMETDFVPELGCNFSMWCENVNGGTDHYLCKVLELNPPSQMLWSWVLDGNQDQGETLVEFILSEVGSSTHLVIRHSGDRDPGIIDAFKSGWPAKLDLLKSVLSKK